MNNRHLFDASSLIYALKLKRIDKLYDNYTQQLAVYEVLNTLWKEVHLFKKLNPKEALQLIDVFKNMLKYMRILRIESLETQILNIALKLGVTVYDASYMVLAKKNNLTLVTEDKKLRNKSSTLIKTVSLKELT